MPDAASTEKRDILRNMGADLRIVETLPYANMGNYQHVSKRLAEELKEKNGGNVIWGNQFDNIANAKFHEKTTAQEIFDQTDGKITHFIVGVGTGGTISGVGLD